MSVRPLRLLTAAAATVVLGAGLVLVPGAAGAASTPPWEPDPLSVGTITFYDANGNVVTSGPSNSGLFARYAVASQQIRTGDGQAQLLFANPDPNSQTQNWYREQIGLYSNYPTSSGPANIQTLSKTHPVVVILEDQTFDGFRQDSVTSNAAGYANMVQVRLRTAPQGQNLPTTQYAVADVVIDSAKHTWTQVYPAPASSGPDASSLSIATSASSVAYGSSVTVSGVLKDTVTGAAVAGTSVVLKSRASSSAAWKSVKTLTTSSSGKVSSSQKPTGNIQYELVYGGSSTVAAVTSSVKSVSVTQKVSAALDKSSVVHGSTVKVYGTVAPAVAGTTVTVEYLSGSTWKSTSVTAKVANQTLPDGTTTVGYVASFTPSKVQTYSLRATVAATSTLAAGASAAVTLKST